MSDKATLKINQTGTAEQVDSVGISSIMGETEFEKHLVQAPSVLGEQLLVIGRQLSEFEEDSKRLDMLAVDTSGEIVLIELKASPNFEFTDLQAIGYAGAYSSVETERLAKTLLTAATVEPASTKWVPAPWSSDETEPSVDTAKQAIQDFLEIDSFDEWRPSQHVRIKLVAPDYPRRVLMSVRWLHDLYGIDIEAIQVNAFPSGEGGDAYLTFDRILPLPGDEEFSLTYKQEAAEKRSENKNRAKNKSVLPLLLENKLLHHGDTLVITKSAALPKELRPEWDPTSPVFQVKVDAAAGKVRWRPDPDGEEEIFSPARLANHLYDRFLDEPVAPFATSVGSSFTKGPGGPTLEEIALKKGLWK